jgi:hypothetical protein
MQLEWVADSAFRFFPAQRDELFGYVLHLRTLRQTKRLPLPTGVNLAISSIW